MGGGGISYDWRHDVYLAGWLLFVREQGRWFVTLGGKKEVSVYGVTKKMLWREFEGECIMSRCASSSHNLVQWIEPNNDSLSTRMVCI